MANSRLPQFSTPSKIEPPKEVKPRTNRKEWQKLIQEQLQFYKKMANREKAREMIAAYDLDGEFAERKSEALLNTLETVYKRYMFLYNEGEHPNELGEEWISLNLSFVGYSAIETQSHILFGAALWILDRITADNDACLAMYKLLPRDDYALADIYFPDVWDCQHDVDLIASVQYVLHYRNSDGAGIEEDGQGNEKVITDRLTAAGAQRTGLPCRKSFEGLIELIPKADIERAIRHFEECFWAWLDRYIACIGPLEQRIADCKERIESVRQEYNANCDELAAAMAALEKRFREQKKAARDIKKSSKPNPLLMNPVHLPEINTLSSTTKSQLQLPGVMIESDPAVHRALMLSEKAVQLDEQFEEASNHLYEATDKKNYFMLKMARQGHIFRQDCIEIFGEAVAAAMTELTIADPYELCFALLYLVDQGSDLPWLYGVGSGLMQEVTESLPWGIIEYDEMDDEIWDDVPTASKPSAIPDWYECSYSTYEENQ